MNNISWLFKGLGTFGLCVGLYVGLSVSPIVNSVVSLMFALIGGSIVILIKGRTEEELNIIGKSVFMIALFMIVGALVGSLARGGWKSEEKILSSFNDKKFFEFVLQLSKDQVDKEKICSLVKRYKNEKGGISLTEEYINKLASDDSNVSNLTFAVILDTSVSCFKGDDTGSNASGLKLHSGSAN